MFFISVQSVFVSPMSEVIIKHLFDGLSVFVNNL